MFTIFSYRITEKQLLIAILLLGALLRFWGIGSAEIFNDEGFYAFRSIGYFDYIQNDAQTTPVQWFRNTALPWWTNLSFHDHPPLFFLIQNIFFRIFGDSLFVARLPSLLAGMGTIYLFYLLGKRFFQYDRFKVIPILSRTLDNVGANYNPNLQIDLLNFNTGEGIGLLAAFLLAINHIHIWISRSSLMESLLIFLIFLNIYYFFRLIDDRSEAANYNPNLQINWILFGITLGLAFLAKYTSFFLVPVYLTYFAYQSYWSYQSNKSYKPDMPYMSHKSDETYMPYMSHKSDKSYWIYLFFSFGLALLIFSPVLIYNFYLWKTVGHFDLQFASLFHQNTQEWQASLGKIQEPFSNIIENLLAMYSVPFLLTVIFGLILSYKTYRTYRINGTNIIFSWLSLIFITLMLVAVGSAFRFIALYIFPFLFFSVTAILFLSEKLSKNIFLPVFAIFIIYELYFSISGIFFEFPDFGVMKLDAYLEESLGGQRSLRLPQSPNPHLDAVIKEYGIQHPVADESIVIVYDENIALSSKLWLFARRLYYHGILTVTAGQFKIILQDSGMTAFDNSRIYFVKATENTSLNPNFTTEDAGEFEKFLAQELKLRPEGIIYGRDGLPMFSVYKFSF